MPPQAILVSEWSISKNLLLCNCLAKWTETWWESHMEGSVLSFLKAKWKVSDTGSAHWASSSFGHDYVCPHTNYDFWLLLWYLQACLSFFPFLLVMVFTFELWPLITLMVSSNYYTDTNIPFKSTCAFNFLYCVITLAKWYMDCWVM